MKRVKVLNSIFTILMIFLIIPVVSCESEKNTQSRDTPSREAIKQRNAKAIIAGDEARKFVKTLENLKETRATENLYPDYFGGIYLDEKFDINVIFVDNDPDKYNKLVSKHIKRVGFHLRQGTYSLNKLENILEKLDDLLINIPPQNIIENFTAAGLDIKINRVYIELKDISESKVNEFKNAFMDSPAIIYRENKEPVRDVVNINIGSKVRPAGGVSYGSIGYRAQNSSGRRGFVSSGHVFRNYGVSAHINNVKVGNRIAVKREDKVDAAFIHVTNSSYTMTRTVDVTGQVLFGTTTVSAGDRVIVRGGE